MKLTFLIVLLLTQTATDLLKKGDQSYQAFKNGEALQYYKQAYDKNPNDFSTLFKLARSYLDLGEDQQDTNDPNAAKSYEMGVQYTRELVQKFPKKVESHLYLGIGLGRIGLYSGGKRKVELSREIKAHLDQALAIDPNYPEIHISLGVYNREIATLNWFLKNVAVKLFGGVPKASMKDSLYHLERATILKPSSVVAHLEYGISLWEMGEKEKAKQMWQKALSLPIVDHRDPVYKKQAQEWMGKK